MKFQDRQAAGRILAELVKAQPDLADAVVLGLPRGGVPVAFEVARMCKLPLDVLVVRKLGVPGQRELAMGAIASDGTVVLNEEIIQELRILNQTVEAVMHQEKETAEQQEHLYRQGRAPVRLEGATAILVDDGLATGATMRAAVRAIRPRATRVVVAVPVGAAGGCHELTGEADLVLCAYTPSSFGAVGQFYGNFEPTSAEEVCRLLAEA